MYRTLPLKSFALMVALFLFVRAQSQVFQANSTSGCTPVGVVISVTSPAASGITSYSWQITTPSGTVLSASSAQYIAIFSQPGSYDVSLTINGNQTTSINDYITVHALPTANFSAGDPIGCFPLCVDFSDISISGGSNIVEWSWDFGDGGSSSQQNPTYCYTQVGTFTPVFSIEDQFGCFADITMPGLVQVGNNFPIAQFQPSSQLDCNPPVDITLTNTSTGTSALTSAWDFGDGNIQSVNGTTAQTHTYSNVGSYDACLTVTDAIGCSDQVCLPITIFGTANAQYTVSATNGCEGDVFTFTSTTTPAPASVQWDFNNDGITDSNNPTASYSYINAGVYQPSLSVSYSSGCSDVESSAYALNIIDGVNMSFTGDTLQSCSFPFTVQFENQSTGQAPISYEWFIDGVSAGNTTDLTHVFSEYGAYDIKLVATNSAGCTNELLLTDYVLVQLPIVDFDNGVSACTDQNVPIFNVQVTSVDPVQFYFWDFNSDGTTDAQGIAPSYMYSSPGIYNITLTIETVTGCTASYTNTQNINVLTMVVADFTASTDTTCAGEAVEFCVEYQPGNTFSWNFFDGSGWVIMPLNESCLIHDYTDTGWYDLTLTVFNGACNVLQTFENFIYVEPPVALFEYQVVCGDLSAEFLDTSIGADSIVWDFGDGSPPLSNSSNPIHNFPASGTYTTTLAAYANGSNCPDFQSAQITVSAPDPTMFFTPTTGCPPLDVVLHSQTANPHWDVSISNGDHITVNWMEAGQYWAVAHTSNSGNNSYAFSNPAAIYWPHIIFLEGGYFDVSISTTDINGCSVSYLYDDVIHVSANPDFATFSTTTIDACNDVNLGFQPDLVDLVSWQWVFGDGTISNSENPFHTFSPPYDYDQPLSATLTATDTLGCVSTVTQEILVALPPVVDFIAASDPSCIGDVVQFINFSEGPSGTTYEWDFGDIFSGSNSSNLDAPTHTFSANGTYEVCLSADNGSGCIRTDCNDDAVHIVNPEVSFEYTSSINNCLYGVQFTNTTAGTVVNSAWEFGDGQSGFGLLAYHTYPIGVYDVTLTVINNYGCVDSTVVPDILSYGNQVGLFSTLLDSASCAPFETSFSAFNPNDTYFQYFWDFNDGSGDPSGNTTTGHTYLQPGTYCPSIIMTDPNGCPVLISCTEPIEVEEFLLDYSVPEYICFGDTIEFEIDNGTTYQWQDLAGLSQGPAYNQFILHPLDDTEYILTGFYSDCVRVDTINLEVKDLPQITFDMVSSVCFQDDVITLSDGLPNSPPGNYFIEGLPSAIFDPSWQSSLNYTVLYEYTDTFQCSNSAIDFVYIHPLPVAIFNDIADLCEDADSIALNTAAPIGGIYILNSDTITTFSPSAGYGNYDFEYVFTDGFGCVDVDSARLVVRPLPEPVIAFSDMCLDVGLQIENLSVIAQGDISTTTWSFGAGGVDSQFTPSLVYFPSFGSYPISMIAESEFGCTSSLDSVVNIHAVPIPQFTQAPACQFAAQTFYDYSTIASDSIVTWLWSAEQQTFNSPDSLNFAFTGWGNLPLSLHVISDFGCDDTLTANIVVHPSPVVSLDFENNCFGTESVFASSSTIPIGGVTSEEWSFGDGHLNEFGNTADNLYDSTGIYYIQLVATSNLGCTSEMNDSIRIYPIPVVDFIVDPNSFCVESDFTLLDLSSVDPPSHVAQWIWFFGDTMVSSSQNPQLQWAESGTYDVTLSVISNHGCASDSMLPNGITFYPKPEAGFYTSEEAFASSPIIQITNASSEDVVSWYYDFGDETSDVFPDGEHFYEETGVYRIVQSVWNTFGCGDSTSRVIEIKPEMLIYVPNAFTPDANTHNEIFIPIISGFDVTHYSLKIFDRWGVLVFSTGDAKSGWDGTFQGGPAEDGAYSWSMEIRSATDVTIHRKSGNVMLLR